MSGDNLLSRSALADKLPSAPAPELAPAEAPTRPAKSAPIPTHAPTPVVPHNTLPDNDLQLAVAAAAPGGVRLVITPESASLDGGSA